MTQIEVDQALSEIRLNYEQLQKVHQETQLTIKKVRWYEITLAFSGGAVAVTAGALIARLF